jgi:hypothetical protein
MKIEKHYYIYLLYLIVVTFIATGVSFSRYSTTSPAIASVIVARPVLEYVPVSAALNEVDILDLGEGITLDDLLPGDVLVYNFDVINFRGAEPNLITNQVLLKYKILVEFDPDEKELPLDYELIVLDEEEHTLSGDWTYMGFGDKKTHSYSLIVSWDEYDSEYIYSERQQSVRIKILIEQADSAE